MFLKQLASISKIRLIFIAIFIFILSLVGTGIYQYLLSKVYYLEIYTNEEEQGIVTIEYRKNETLTTETLL